MTTISRRRQATRLDGPIERLQEANDQARAVLTIPARTSSEHRLSSGAPQPSVDLELWAQHVRYARRGDTDARDALVEAYQPQAQSLARRFYRHGERMEDLSQVACEALLMALSRFEPERCRPFMAYAKPTITGVIQRHYRDLGWSIRVPRWVHESVGPIRNARNTLTQDLGRDPTDREVAEAVGISEERLRQVMSAEGTRQPGSLDVVDSETKLHTEQVVGRADPDLGRAENRVALQQALELLSDDDRHLLERYFVDEKTQAELAGEFGCSQMQVSRLLDSAVRRLRRRMTGA